MTLTTAPSYWHAPRMLDPVYTENDITHRYSLYGKLGKADSAADAILLAQAKNVEVHNQLFFEDKGCLDLKGLRSLLTAIGQIPRGNEDELNLLCAITLGGCANLKHVHTRSAPVEMDHLIQPEWWGHVFRDSYGGTGPDDVPPCASSIDAALSLAAHYLRGFEVVDLLEDTADLANPRCVCTFEATDKSHPFEPAYRFLGAGSTMPRAILVALIIAVVLIKYGDDALKGFLTDKERELGSHYGTGFI
jgi:hypothetical protein